MVPAGLMPFGIKSTPPPGASKVTNVPCGGFPCAGATPEMKIMPSAMPNKAMRGVDRVVIWHSSPQKLRASRMNAARETVMSSSVRMRS